jgi:hypothetical protein
MTAREKCRDYIAQARSCNWAFIQYRALGAPQLAQAARDTRAWAMHMARVHAGRSTHSSF